MSPCNFSIEFSEDPVAMIKKAEAAIRASNGVISGDPDSRSFQLTTPIGSVSGNYNIENSVISIQITQKPLLLGCSKIQSELRKYLSG